MSDFISQFWSNYITVITVTGILGCLWLLWATARTKVKSAADNTTGHVWDEDLREMNNPLPRWWVWMFVISVVFGFAYLALYPGLGSHAGTLGWTSLGEYRAEVSKAEADEAPLYARFSAMTPEALSRDPQAKRAIPHHLPAAAGNPARRRAPPPWPRHGRAPRRPAHWYRKAQSRHDQVRPPVPPIPRDAKRHPGKRNWTALLPPHSRALSWQIALHHPAPARMTKPEPFAGSELHPVIIPRRRQRAAMPPFRFQP